MSNMSIYPEKLIPPLFQTSADRFGVEHDCHCGFLLHTKTSFPFPFLFLSVIACGNFANCPNESDEMICPNNPGNYKDRMLANYQTCLANCFFICFFIFLLCDIDPKKGKIS